MNSELAGAKQTFSPRLFRVGPFAVTEVRIVIDTAEKFYRVPILWRVRARRRLLLLVALSHPRFYRDTKSIERN